MNMVALTLPERQLQSPSYLIAMIRSSQLPITCDFLYSLSIAMAPYRCSIDSQADWGRGQRVANLTCPYNFLLANSKNNSSNLSHFLLSPSLLASRTKSSSLVMPTLNFKPVLSVVRANRIILVKGMVFLLTSNSFSRKVSSVSMVSFLSSTTTACTVCSKCCEFLVSGLPRLRLTSGRRCLGSLISSSSLLLACSSDEEVPNSSRLSCSNSFLRFSFIRMYSSCCLLNSASFSSSLSSPTKSRLPLTCLYSISTPGTTVSFFLACPTSSELLALSLMDKILMDYNSTTAELQTPTPPFIIITMRKEMRRPVTLDVLVRHQERIRSMVDRIGQYQSTFQLTHQFRSPPARQREQYRQRYKTELMEENIRLINRIQSIGPKIEINRFPEVKTNPMRLKILSSSGWKTANKTKYRIMDSFRNQDELYEQNVKLITTIQSTSPKVNCWTERKAKLQAQQQTKQRRQRQHSMLQKFKDISKQMSRVRAVQRGREG